MPPFVNLPGAMGWEPTFTKEGDPIGDFAGGYLSGRKVAEKATERKAANKSADAVNDAGSFLGKFGLNWMDKPAERVPGNWLSDVSEAHLGAKAIQEKASDPYSNLKELKLLTEIQGEGLRAKSEALVLQSTAEDQRAMASLMESMSINPNYLAETKTPPVFKTPQYQRAFDGMRDMHSASLVTKSKAADVALFSQKIATILPEDRAAIQGMEPNRDGSISSNQWQALNLSEQRMRAAAENDRARAEIVAMQRGDVPTTTITEKGVTTTFKPATTPTEDKPPKTLDLGGGTTIAWIPGSKALHVIKDGKKQEYTPFQMASIAKGLDDKDPRKKQITDFLANTAVEQATPKAAAPDAAPATDKVRMLSPQGVPGFVPSGQVEEAKKQGFSLP